MTCGSVESLGIGRTGPTKHHCSPFEFAGHGGTSRGRTPWFSGFEALFPLYRSVPNSTVEVKIVTEKPLNINALEGVVQW